MRSFIIILSLSFGLTACQQTQVKTEVSTETELPSTGNFGDAVTVDGALDIIGLPELFTTSDTISAKVKGIIVSSCRHSGCWMDMDMGNGKTVHVIFAEEAFTIPLDAAGKTALIEGKAIRELIPVETLRNYAADDGKTKEEIALITKPEFTYGFVAKGVLIR